MNLSLSQRFRINETWSVGKSSGFIDISNGVPSGSMPEEAGFYPYSGFATSIELNHHFNYWAVVQLDNGGYDGKSTVAHVVFFPSNTWFKEWLDAIPAKHNPQILAQCVECKTGVE